MKIHNNYDEKIILFLLTFSFLLLFSARAEAADRFWVGNGGNWSDATNHWATASGGAPGSGNLPTSADNCYFDANSLSSASQTVTLDAQTPDPVCASMVWTGALNSPTLSFSDNSDIYGSITFISGMTVNAGTSTVTLRAASGALTLTSAGKSFYNLTMNDAAHSTSFITIKLPPSVLDTFHRGKKAGGMREEIQFTDKRLCGETLYKSRPHFCDHQSYKVRDSHPIEIASHPLNPLVFLRPEAWGFAQATEFWR